MFNFGLSQGRAFSMYRANVSYTWGTTLAQDGTRHLKDLGKSPKLSVQLEGNGLHLNGVDQSLVVELPHELGDEEVVNGGFETDLSGWGANDVWSWVDGRAYIDDSAGYNRLYQDYIMKVGFLYKITCDVEITSGTLRLYDQSALVGSFTSTQTFEIYHIATSDGNFNFQSSSSGCVGYVDNFSVKQVTQEELHLYTFNHDTSNIEYQNITTPIPYYDFGKVDGTGDYLERVIGNTIATKQAFTASQLEALYKEPERFLYRQNETIKSFVLNQAEIDNVVTWMTNTDNDGYSRELVGYSEGVDAFDEAVAYDDEGGVITLVTGGYTAVSDGTAGSPLRPALKFPNIALGLYKLSLDTTVVSGVCNDFRLYDGTKYVINVVPVVGGLLELIVDVLDTDCFISYNGADYSFDLSVIASMKKLTGINQITNITNACRDDAKQLTNGYQHTAGVVTDSFNIPINYIDALVLKGTERPALAIPLTDTELWGDGTGFVIEFVIRRGVIDTNLFLLYSILDNSHGLKLASNRNYAEDTVQLFVYDGTTDDVDFRLVFDGGEYNYCVFEVSPTSITSILNNVEIDTKEHSFVPSGLSFADSTQLAPKAKMPLFKMWYGDNYAKYDREKSAELGRETIANIEGWEDTGSVDIELFNYEPANGDRLIENGGE